MLSGIPPIRVPAAMPERWLGEQAGRRWRGGVLFLFLLSLDVLSLSCCVFLGFLMQRRSWRRERGGCHALVGGGKRESAGCKTHVLSVQSTKV
jgi:hypothetical protein